MYDDEFQEILPKPLDESDGASNLESNSNMTLNSSQGITIDKIFINL